MKTMRLQSVAGRALTIASLLLLFAGNAWPACSPYMGLVTINEASKDKQNPSNNNSGDSANDFVEIKLLDNSIPSSVYNTWSLQICENSSTGCNTISVSSFDASGNPWLVVSGLNTVGRYLNFSVGTDILLLDGNGDAIDYLSTGGYSANQPVCTFVFDTTATTSSSTRRIKRQPDGIGDWDVPTGNSEPPTDNTTNDDGVPSDAPSLSVDDVVVNAGGIAVFTLTLDAAYTSDVNLTVQTVNNTAVAGSDFVAVNTTATITAGNTSTTVSVTTNSSGAGVFYLALSNADNAVIIDQLGRGLIIPPPLTEWRFDENAWTGAANEVLDQSANALHGTAISGPTTDDTNPAISGSVGTCGYGEFDGNNDHVEVADNNLLDLTSDLSITAWIRPTTSGVNQTILTKGGTFTLSYRLRINTSNQLEFTWCTARFLGVCISSNTITSTGTIASNTWTHVAVSFSSGNQTLYINSSADGSSTSTTPISVSGTSLTIGAALGIFSTDSEFSGQIDEVRLYEIGLDGALVAQIAAETHNCLRVSLDHYLISFDGGVTANDSTGVTCEALSVTIVAHGPGHVEPVTPGIGTVINLSTSTGLGFWSNPTAGSLIDNGNGNAQYTFAGNDAVTLQLNHTQAAINPSAVNININASSANPSEDAGEDPDVQFFDTGFRFVDGSDNAVIANQIAAANSTTHFLQAIRTDTQTGECVGVFANGAQVDVELGTECNDPLTCAGLQLAFTNNGNTTSLATSDNNGATGAAAYTTVANILFGADSKAGFIVNYPDVGALSLHARYQIENEDGSPSGDFMQGSSNAFIVSPADFILTTVNAGAITNPATTGSGSGFITSGDPFAVLVEARNAAGNITPNYGNEISSESITLNIAGLVFPAGGSLGVLANPSSFSATTNAGEFANTILTWSEVGTFTVTASVADGDYLGAGNVVGSVSGNIGRFYPAEFELVSSTLSNSCAAGGFSYLSEPAINVSYQVHALNRNSAVVVNYDNADLVYPTGTVSVHGENNNSGIDFASRLSVVSSQWDDGVYGITDANASVARASDVAANIIPDGPYANFQVGLQVTDIDNVNFTNLDFKPSDANNCIAAADCDSRALGGTLNLRFGQLYLADVHGPESAAIPMVWETQYWNNGQFITHTDDQCTQIPLSAVAFVGASSSVNAAADTITVTLGGIISVFNFADPIGGSDCLTATDIGICAGQAGTFYGAPGAVVTYPLDINLATLDFLQGDWNQDGNYNDNAHPRVYVRFQNYRGHDRIIYWRERLQ